MRLYIFLLLPLSLFAVSLDTLIENAKDTHTSIKAIQHRISAIDYEYDVSRNFSNPELSINVSDIHLKDISNRSIEPMQYSSINFKQKIPYFGKRDANSKKISAKKQRISLTLDEAKVKLVKAIKTTAYSIWQRDQELKITNEYIKLTQQNIELYSAYSSSDTSSHMSIMSAEMTLSQLKIKQSRLQSLLLALYKKISYLSAMEVKSIELSMEVKKPKDISFYTDAKYNNSSYKVKEALHKESRVDIQIKELSSNIDPVIQVGYFHRESFENYVNVGVGFSLPLYGTERSKTEVSRKLSLAAKEKVTDYKNLLDSEISQNYVKLQDAYKVYDIIQNQSMPQIQHMFELSSSSIKNGDKLYIYINLLEKKLSLDEQSIGIVANYYKTLANLEALIGEKR